MKTIFTALFAFGLAVFSTGCGMFGHAEQTRAMQQVAEACRQYAAEHHQTLPERLEVLKPDYLPMTFDVKNFKITLLGKISACHHPEAALMLCDTRPLSGGKRIVAFADGRVTTVSGYENQTQLRILTMACMIYPSYNRNRFPNRLEDLRKFRLIAPTFDLTRYVLCIPGSPAGGKQAGGTVLLREKEAHDGYRGVAYVDGQVEMIKE